MMDITEIRWKLNSALMYISHYVHQSVSFFKAKYCDLNAILV